MTVPRKRRSPLPRRAGGVSAGTGVRRGIGAGVAMIVVPPSRPQPVRRLYSCAEMLGEMDGSVRIDWSADQAELIRVYAPRRDTEELTAFARRVADHALLNRTVADLRSALRAEFDATFDLEERDPEGADAKGYVVVTLHPPQGLPNPD